MVFDEYPRCRRVDGPVPLGLVDVEVVDIAPAEHLDDGCVQLATPPEHRHLAAEEGHGARLQMTGPPRLVEERGRDVALAVGDRDHRAGAEPAAPSRAERRLLGLFDPAQDRRMLADLQSGDVGERAPVVEAARVVRDEVSHRAELEGLVEGVGCALADHRAQRRVETRHHSTPTRSGYLDCPPE